LFVTNNPPKFTPLTNGYYIPDWKIVATNRMQYMLVCNSNGVGQIVDWVNSGDLTFTLDVRSFLNTNDPNSTFAGYWYTNPVTSQGVTGPYRIQKQVQTSYNLYANYDSDFVNFNDTDQDKMGAVTNFYNFWNAVNVPTNKNTIVSNQTPFNPTWNIMQTNT